jgi:hypothetical protein
MAYLYPRFLADQAKPLYTEYTNLPLEELSRRVAFTHESAVYAATGGDRISASMLENLRDLVLGFAVQRGFPGASTRHGDAEFDLQVARTLHREAGMVPAEASSGDVWAFLALMVLPDVAYWRYYRPPGDRILGTDLTRHVYGRLWWRAQLVHDPDDPTGDPYAALNILGEGAFDQIYARRKALGASPHLVKAILRVCDDPEIRDELTKSSVIKDFLKRLLRLAPFMIFEALDESQLDTELRAAADEAIRAIRHAQ